MTTEELSKLTPEQKRIRIAELCGYNLINGHITKDGVPILHVGTIKTTWRQLDRSETSLLPDYLNDLNAMHEAEKILTRDQRCAYALELARMTDESCAIVGSHWFRVSHATASQRADAFLLTLA